MVGDFVLNWPWVDMVSSAPEDRGMGLKPLCALYLLSFGQTGAREVVKLVLEITSGGDGGNVV